MSESKGKRKRRFGDRKDAFRIKENDPLHIFMPYIMPNRTDNEAVLKEVFDITKVNKYLAEKNSRGDDFKFTLFHFICAAIAKTIQMRPCLNRFYAGKRLYERYDIIFSFVVKKQFTDSSAETLAKVIYDKESDVSPVDQFHDSVKKIATKVRKDNKTSGTMEKIAFLSKIPRPIMRVVMGIMNILDSHGKMPASACKDDPDYSTVFVTNLGSINMHADYHHLANWGTNSFFAVVNSKEFRPFFKEDGSYEMKDSVDLGLTIDERIADGVYFAKSLIVLRYFFENPYELDKPASYIPEIDISIHH